MNLPSFKRALPVLALLLIGAVLVAVPYLDSSSFASLRYQHCGQLVTSEPEKALALARAWRISHPASPFAQHCEALALFATKDYAHAGDAFVALAKTTTDNPPLATQLFVQGAKAYSAANMTEQAKQAAVAALLLQPDDAGAKALLADIDKKNDNSASPPAPAKKSP